MLQTNLSAFFLLHFLQQLEALQAQYEEDFARLTCAGPGHHTHSRRALHELGDFYRDFTRDESLPSGCGIEYVDVRDPQWTTERFEKEVCVCVCVCYAFRALSVPLRVDFGEWLCRTPLSLA